VTREIRLRAEHHDRDHRYLDARTDQRGDLHLVGHDLGPSVEEWFGEGEDEYEWERVVRAADLPALAVALGATATDDVLDVLAALPSPEGSYQVEQLLRDGVVSSETHVF
jgi:hypothetical protein